MKTVFIGVCTKGGGKWWAIALVAALTPACQLPVTPKSGPGLEPPGNIDNNSGMQPAGSSAGESGGTSGSTVTAGSAASAGSGGSDGVRDIADAGLAPPPDGGTSDAGTPPEDCEELRKSVDAFLLDPILMSCTYAVPMEGLGYLPDRINLRYDTQGVITPLARVASKSACDPQFGGWYYETPGNADGKGMKPVNAIVCAQSCRTLAVEMVFGCPTTEL